MFFCKFLHLSLFLFHQIIIPEQLFRFGSIIFGVFVQVSTSIGAGVLFCSLRPLEGVTLIHEVLPYHTKTSTTTGLTDILASSHDMVQPRSPLAYMYVNYHLLLSSPSIITFYHLLSNVASCFIHILLLNSFDNLLNHTVDSHNHADGNVTSAAMKTLLWHDSSPPRIPNGNHRCHKNILVPPMVPSHLSLSTTPRSRSRNLLIVMVASS